MALNRLFRAYRASGAGVVALAGSATVAAQAQAALAVAKAL